MRIALDTNIFAYAEGVQHSPADAAKVAASRKLLTGLLADLDCTCVAPVQALLELHRVLTHKGGRSPEDARVAVRRLADAVEPAPTSTEVLERAMEIAQEHRLQIFDSVILAASLCARCDFLLTEDLQDGFRLRGLTVANPFARPPHRAIAGLLDS